MSERWKKSGKTAGQLGHRTLKANYSATFNWITSVYVCVSLFQSICMCVCVAWTSCTRRAAKAKSCEKHKFAFL